MPERLPGRDRCAQLRRAIADGNYEKAYLIARGPNPLASICGRICGAPCEAACRRGALDRPVSIRALKRTATERFGGESGRFEPLEILERVLELSATEHACEGGEELRSLRERTGLLEPGEGPDEPTGGPAWARDRWASPARTTSRCSATRSP